MELDRAPTGPLFALVQKWTSATERKATRQQLRRRLRYPPTHLRLCSWGAMGGRQGASPGRPVFKNQKETLPE